MTFVLDPLASTEPHAGRSRGSRAALGLLTSTLISVFTPAVSQTSPALNYPAVAPRALSSAPLSLSAPLWKDLAKAQVEALAPLDKSWDTLSAAQKRKWITLAQTYPGLSPENKQKLHSRMVEWAALTPRERELARLNFVETKKLAPADPSSDWQAYQALSQQEKQELAAQAKKKPVGAAIAVKPTSPDKLATVPITRLTPRVERKEATARQAVNPNTLLPQPPAPIASAASSTPAEPEPEPAPSN
jgi:hypothetical protein